MSFIFSGLQDIENFFSTAGADLTAITHFLATEAINFANAVITGLEDLVSFFQLLVTNPGKAWTEIQQTFINVFNTVYQTLANAWNQFATFMSGVLQTVLQDLYNVFKDFINFLIGLGQTAANDLAGIVQTIIQPALTAALQAFGQAGQAASQVVQQFLPLISPIMLLRAVPGMLDKAGEIFGDIELSLEILGLGGNYKLKLGEFLEKIGEPIRDFLKEISEETMTIFRDSIKEPFISSFRVSLRQLWNDVGLGDLPFRDPNFKDVARFLTAKKFDEVVDHLNETLLLTGYPQWFTDTYHNPPTDSYIPGNPFYHPLPLTTAVPAVQLGLMEYNQMLDLAWYNLATPSQAALLYKVQTAHLVNRTILQGLRYFVVEPKKAYELLKAGTELRGEALYNFLYQYEYAFGLQRTIKQFLRALLSRALSNFGRPYLEQKELFKTTTELFKKLGYPDEIEKIFEIMITQSQEVQINQLLYQYVIALARVGSYNEKTVKELAKKYKMDEALVTQQAQNYIQLAITQKAITIIEAMLQRGAIDIKHAISLLKPFNVDKHFLDTLENLYVLHLNAELGIKYIESLSAIGAISEHEVRTVTKQYNLNEAYTNTLYNIYNNVLVAKAEEEQAKTLIGLGVEYKSKTLNQQYFNILEQTYLQKAQVTQTISYIKSLLTHGLIAQADAEKQLLSLHLNPVIAKLIVEEAYNVFYAENVVNHIKTLLNHGLLSPSEAEKQLKLLHLDPNVIKLIIEQTYNVFYAETVIRYVEAQLRKFLISKTQAEELLLKVGMPKDLIDLYVAMFTPDVINIRTIATLILQGDIYHVGKVPIKVPTKLTELEKLGIDRRQAEILAQEVTAQIGLELWRANLPKLHDILNAITYGYDYKKLLDLAFIPSELFDLHANLQTWINVAKVAHNLHSVYVRLLQYNAPQIAQIESVLTKYGITAEQLALYKLQATIEKLIVMYQELYLTPSKVMSLAEYLPNWKDLLQKSFQEYSVPTELQTVYLQATQNKRLLRYVNEIITTLLLLAEKHKLDVATAQQFLVTLKQYGLSDDEIQLILLNIQLRSQY